MRELKIYKVYVTWWRHVLGLIDDELGGIRGYPLGVANPRHLSRADPGYLWIYRCAENRHSRWRSRRRK